MGSCPAGDQGGPDSAQGVNGKGRATAALGPGQQLLPPGNFPRWVWLSPAGTAPWQNMGECAGTARGLVPSQLWWLGDRSSPSLSSAGMQSSPCHLAGRASRAPSLWLGGTAQCMPVPCWDRMVLSPSWMRLPPRPRPPPGPCPRAAGDQDAAPPQPGLGAAQGCWGITTTKYPVPNELPEPSITSLPRPPIGYEPDEVTEGTLHHHHHLLHHHHRLGMPLPQGSPCHLPPALQHASPCARGPV